MEKDFVPPKESKDLKELGFGKEIITCYGSYINEKFCMGFFTSTHCSEDTILAPTYSQAFKFFSEKYGMFSSIWCFETEQKFFIEFGFGIQKFEVNNKEEAEIECLKKLIELCKNKK